MPTALDGALEARSGDGHLRVAGRFDELDLRTGDGRVDASVLRGSQPDAAVVRCRRATAA